MSWKLTRLALPVFASFLLACAPDPAVQPDGGAGGSGGGDAGGTVTYTRDVQPLLNAKCGFCHGGQNQGLHNIATTYADVHRTVFSHDSEGCWVGDDPDTAIPKTIGECSLILSESGRMPLGFGCGGINELPGACVTDAELAVLAAWVAAGMPE